MVQARNTDRRWSKSLQHEHSLRVQLQENIVTMANDLYGLENQAKNSVRKGKGAATPSVPTSGDTRLESGDYLLSHHPAEEPKLSQEEAAVSSDDEDGRFFDAPEISLEEWEKTVEASSEGSPTGGRSKEGLQRSTSLNEVSIQPVSPSDGTKQLPITSDRRMTVSLSTCTQKYLQWSLYIIVDTLGPTILSLIERFPLSRGSKSTVTPQQYAHLFCPQVLISSGGWAYIRGLVQTPRL